MKKYFILVLILVSNLFFSQTNINSKISTLYAKLNFLKQETRKSEREINAINTENLSSRWLFRKDFIINNNKTSLRGIEKIECRG
jgi:cell division protein FtsB